MSSNADRNVLILYGRWERPSTTGLYGMTWGVTVFAGGLVIANILLFLITNSLAVMVVSVPLSALMVGPLVTRIGGRTGWELLMLRGQFWWAKWRGETTFRGGAFGVVPGVGRMPGIAGDTRLYEYELRNGDRFGLVHLKAKNHFAVSFSIQPRGQERVDQWQINDWVSGWGDFLAQLGGDRGAVGACVVVESVPDNRSRITAEVKRITHPDAPAYARQVMAEAAMGSEAAIVRSEIRLTLTFGRMREAADKEVADQAAEIGRKMSSLMAACAHAGLDATPMTAGEWCVAPTRAYNPQLTEELEQITGVSGEDALRWQGAGPVTSENKWDHLVHNGYRSITWEMSTAPAGQVPSNVLRPLLIPRADVRRKRVAMIYRVHNTAEAVKLVDSDYREALAAEQSKKGVVAASATVRVENTGAARREQALGAGLTRFGMLVTATAGPDEDLPSIRAEIEGMADSAHIGLRRCYGYQDAAFAGSLGIGIILPEYASTSSKISA
ncbi:SCO6880 family protein [Williamsia muralis]|uniref:SCO6880 family protein n=1 Tax=Williamsia marianensis TaxID=85044 RepID=UPI0038305748